MSRKRKTYMPMKFQKHKTPKWAEMFEVLIDIEVTKGALLGYFKSKETTYFLVRNKLSNKTVGRYKDMRYARKQAKYKYYCQLRKIDKILLVD